MIKKITTPRHFDHAVGEQNDRDDLEDFIEEQHADPEFRAAYEDAVDREVLLKTLVSQRKALSLSQEEVAKRMGTTQSAVSDLERGAADPRWTTLQRYARAVGARVQAIVCDDTELAEWYRFRTRAREWAKLVVESRQMDVSVQPYLEALALQAARGGHVQDKSSTWTLTWATGSSPTPRSLRVSEA